MPAVRCVLLCTPFLLSAWGVVQAADRAVPDHKVVELVDERLADWWFKPDEKRFDLIAWAADIRTAKKLAAEHQRPLFLFTMDGRVNTGRC
ncbi:MAG: hypothetical protein WD278_02260 [Pirellulales bacterium]